MPHVTIVQTEDWIVVYRGDDCVWSGHSIDGLSMLSILSIPHSTYYESWGASEENYYDTSWFQTEYYDHGRVGGVINQSDLDRRVNEGLMRRTDLTSSK